MPVWLDIVLGAGIAVITAAVVLAASAVYRTAGQLLRSVAATEARLAKLAAETEAALQGVRQAAESADERLCEISPLAAGIGGAGEALTAATKRLRGIGERSARAAEARLTKAALSNERGVELALRCLDAGWSLWSAWTVKRNGNARLSSSAGGQQPSKGEM